MPPSRIVLASLPFGPQWVPSLGLSLLKAGLAERGLDAKVLYFTLRLAKELGYDLYRELALRKRTDPDLLGDWIAASGRYDRSADEVRRYLEEELRPHEDYAREGLDTEAFLDQILALTARFPALLDAWAEEVLALHPRVVGFTTVFEQNLASLGLARRLKAARPDLLIVLGGANCEGPMGEALFRSFPELDLVFSGESEARFPAAMAAYLATGTVPRMPGVHARPWLVAGELACEPYVSHLDELPVPDFSDFFEQHAALGLDQVATPSIAFESSRGCWWGQKQHCTFCGLNGETMAYRSKSPERAFDELRELTARHPGRGVSVVDNILDLGYFKTFLPRLVEAGNQATLFYEVKANLNKDQLRLLKAAKVLKLQPGIEHLADGVLKLMRKGIRGLQNVQLLKWCLELGLTPGWNFLYGFPGEDPTEYGRLAEWLPLLSHLPPPSASVRVRLDRFSPNFNEAAAMGFARVRPASAYGYVYRLPPEALADLAYFFDFDYADGRDPHAYAAPAVQAIGTWQRDYGTATLAFVDKGEFLLVFDSRPVAVAPLHALAGLDRDLLLACDGLASSGELAKRLGLELPVVEAGLVSLAERRLLLTDGRSWLALPVCVVPEATIDAGTLAASR